MRADTRHRSCIYLAALLGGVSCGTIAARAQDATWLANPFDGEFNRAANWTPATVPTGTAFFGPSTRTNVVFSAPNTTVDGLTFNANAPKYTFFDDKNVTLTGAGITNNSANISSFSVGSFSGGTLNFRNASTAGNAEIGSSLGDISFFDSSSAGTSSLTTAFFSNIIFNDNSKAGSAAIRLNGRGTGVAFRNSASAENAVVTIEDFGAVSFSGFATAGNAHLSVKRDNASLFFGDSSTAAASNITVEAGQLSFGASATAASANIVNRGTLSFFASSTAGNATIITDNPGLTRIQDAASGGNARFVNNFGGTVDISKLSTSGTTAGSIEGAGSFFLGAKQFVVGGNNLSTEVSGVISDGGIFGGSGGSLVKTGTGTLILSGANTYTGGTTISAGTLQFGNGGTTGSISGNVIDNATLAFNRSDSFTYAGAISGTGVVRQNGTGTTILTNTNSYSGATTVNAGALEVDGSLTNSATTVNNGGTLAGSGSVRGVTVNNGGTLMPGPSGTPGTLTINGNLAFTSGALYLVQSTGPASFSATNVSGTAALNGTATVTFAPTAYAPGTYTILTASGGLNGTTFSNFTTSGSFTRVRNPHLTYDATHVFLVFDPGTIILAGGANGNQQGVTAGINNGVLSNNTLPPGFNTLLLLSGASQLNALTQVEGQDAGGAPLAGTQMMNEFLALMLNPFGGAPDGNAASFDGGRSFAAERQVSKQAAETYAAVTPKDRVVKAVPLIAAPRWSIWGAAFGGTGKIGGDTVVGTPDVSPRSYGFAAGADYRVAPDTLLGFALAGGGTSWSLSDGLGSGRGDAFQMGAYGSHSFGAAYLSAALAYAWHGMTTDRTVTVAGIEQLRASFNAQNFGGRIETGYRFDTPYVGVTPYAALQAQTFHTPAYSESVILGAGAFPLSYSARDTTAIRTELGAWFDTMVTVSRTAALSLRARAAWAHDTSNNPGLTAIFQTLPGSSFTISTTAVPRDSVLLSAGAELRLARNWSVGTKFDGESAGRSRTYAGTGVVKYVW
jgi:outer membrane autotransporter protein